MHNKIKEITVKLKEKFVSSEGTATPEKIAQKDWGVFSREFQNTAGLISLQPDLNDHALGGGLDEMISRSPFQPLLFCTS